MSEEKIEVAIAAYAERKRLQRAKENKEKIQKYQHEYYIRHKEKIAERRKKKYLENRQKVNMLKARKVREEENGDDI